MTPSISQSTCTLSTDQLFNKFHVLEKKWAKIRPTYTPSTRYQQAEPMHSPVPHARSASANNKVAFGETTTQKLASTNRPTRDTIQMGRLLLTIHEKQREANSLKQNASSLLQQADSALSIIERDSQSEGASQLYGEISSLLTDELSVGDDEELLVDDQRISDRSGSILQSKSASLDSIEQIIDEHESVSAKLNEVNGQIKSLRERFNRLKNNTVFTPPSTVSARITTAKGTISRSIISSVTSNSSSHSNRSRSSLSSLSFSTLSSENRSKKAHSQQQTSTSKLSKSDESRARQARIKEKKAAILAEKRALASRGSSHSRRTETSSPRSKRTRSKIPTLATGIEKQVSVRTSKAPLPRSFPNKLTLNLG